MGLITIILIVLIVCIVAFVFHYVDDSGTYFLYFSLVILYIVTIILLQQPTAMDVYRGNTTLEVTYKDGVPVDSTVVWKSK